MPVSVECACTNAREKRRKARRTGQVRAKDQHVYEKSDEAFDFGSTAPRGGHAYGQVVLPSVPAEQDLERGEQRHEKRCALAPGKRAERRRERLRQLERYAPAAVTRGRRTWPI